MAELIKLGVIPLDLFTTIWCKVKLHQIQISTKFLRSIKAYLLSVRRFLSMVYKENIVKLTNAIEPISDSKLKPHEFEE